MLVEKEVIGPGTHWYRDEATGLPRKLVVTPTETKYWAEQGNKMLGLGLTVPVPCEHDFTAHPMTPKDKLVNNSGWTKEYRLKDVTDPKTKAVTKDVLFSVLDIQDEELAKKLPKTVRWTSPWISSFTDGQGREWKNVISHIALTTRPRIINQTPFSGIAAALSLATDVQINKDTVVAGDRGICLSKAGKLVLRKRDKKLVPKYPVAFSMYAGGIKLAEEDMPPPKKKEKKPKEKKPGEVDTEEEDDPAEEEEAAPDEKVEGDEDEYEEEPSGPEPFKDASGDVSMEELLADLLGALDIHVEKTGNEKEFKRCLYNAAMTKIHELTAKGRNATDDAEDPNRDNPPGQPPNNPDPTIQQEQQPMYMSLEEINKLADSVVKNIALSMYHENVKSTAKTAELEKKLNSLNDAKLKEENAKRISRVQLISKLSPRVKADLDAMLALPAMALSMGDGGAVVDPMAQTLAVLEKGLADMPRLLTTESAALTLQQQPTDEDMLTAAQEDELADRMARRMGVMEQKKAS